MNVLRCIVFVIAFAVVLMTCGVPMLYALVVSIVMAVAWQVWREKRPMR